MLATKHELDKDGVVLIGKLAKTFVETYEELYYRGEVERLPVCGVNIHYLLHVEQHIRDCGPACYWWQFPMERYCGIIKPYARSKSRLSVSLSNAILLNEHLNHYRFVQPASHTETDSFSGPELLDSITGIKRINMQAEHQCWLPSLGYLLQTHAQSLTIYYFLRCRLRPDLTIGSMKQSRSGINRANYVVCYCTDDRSPLRFGEVKVFADISGFGYWARIKRLGNRVQIDYDARLAYCSGREGTSEWIKVDCIKSLAGTIRKKRDRALYFVTDYDVYSH